MKLSVEQLHRKLKRLNLIKTDGSPISYAQFKNYASIHKYKGRQTKKVTFIGIPKENLFAFYGYFANDTDVNVMKDAYTDYVKLVKGDMEAYEAGNVQWGNAGYPLAYGDLRTLKPV